MAYILAAYIPKNYSISDGITSQEDWYRHELDNQPTFWLNLINISFWISILDPILYYAVYDISYFYLIFYFNLIICLYLKRTIWVDPFYGLYVGSVNMNEINNTFFFLLSTTYVCKILISNSILHSCFDFTRPYCGPTLCVHVHGYMGMMVAKCSS